MIERLTISLEFEGQEVGSISIQDDGNALLCCDVDDMNPTHWGILLCDMLRQVAKSFELNGLTLDHRLLSATEIEASIKKVFDDEFEKPSEVHQHEDSERSN